MRDVVAERAGWRVGLGVGLVSASLLSTELALTRLFSVVLWYHFAFLAVSVALFGTGAAALGVRLWQHRLSPERTAALLARGCVALAAAIVVAVAVVLRFPPDLGASASFAFFSSTNLRLFVVFVASALPFVAGGFVLALALLRHPTRIHFLYAADLAGAAAGCLLVIPLLEWLGAPRALLASAVLAGLAGLPFAMGEEPRRRRSAAAAALAAAGVVLLAASPPVSDAWRLHRAKGLDLDAMPVELERWNSFSMVTVTGGVPFKGWSMSPAYGGLPLAQKAVLIDLHALTPLVAFGGDPATARPVLWDLSSFVHLVRPRGGEVCVIGAGAGRDVLAALAAGAKRVTAVEINPLIVDDIVRGAFRKYAGGLYDRPDVRVVVDDGRAFVRGTSDSFDLIHLSMVDTSAATGAGAYALTENGLYTLEAFGDYFSRLRPDGMLSVASISTRELDGGARLAALVRRAVEESGGDPRRSIAVVSGRWLGRSGAILHNVLVKRGGFTEEEAELVRSTARQLEFTATWIPGDGPETVRGPVGAILGAPDAGAVDRLLAASPLDLSPPTDDRPFFFYQNRWSDALDLLTAGRPLHFFGNGLFVLVRLALISLVMVAAFIVLPLVLRRKVAGETREGAVVDLAYVTCLGLGFMFVEIGLLLRLALYLGRPTYALAVVLFVLLLAGAAGSRASDCKALGPVRRRLVLGLGGVLVLLGVLWLAGPANGVLEATAGWTVAGRAAVAAALLAPLGLFLGSAFPLGLAAAARRSPQRTPWLFGVNAAASVLGSVAATLVCLHGGITAALAVAAFLYAAALVLGLRVVRAPQ